MLRNVLEDYLSSIKERDFDFPLSSLLQGMGFYDIHFTHGAVEFGKDFIAKRVENNVEYQYAIQSRKATSASLFGEMRLGGNSKKQSYLTTHTLSSTPAYLERPSW